MNRYYKLLLLLMSTQLFSSDDALAQGQKGKMYFSNQPFANDHAMGNNSFTSGDFIYGRIETDKGPLKEAFNMASIKTEYAYLQATFRVTRGDGREKDLRQSHYIRMVNGVENGNTLNFDILPSAAKASTIISILDDFSAGQKAGFFTPFLDNSDYYWTNGDYKVAVSLYLKSYNAYGSLEDIEKWPDITGEFTFHFEEKDVPAKRKNNEDANASVLENSLRLDKLPDYFHNPAKITDPELTTAKIMAILKRDLPSVNIVRITIPPFTGLLKDVAKNELGLILYRYVRPYVRVIYRENGKCYLGSISLKEDYTGGGKYGPLRFNKFWGGEGLLDCALVK